MTAQRPASKEKQEPTPAIGTGAGLRRIAIIGGGVSGLGSAWVLNHHSDRFDFRLFEALDRIGGNAFTADTYPGFYPQPGARPSRHAAPAGQYAKL